MCYLREMKPQQFWNIYIYCHREIFFFCGSLNNSFPGEYNPCLVLVFTRDGYLLVEESLHLYTSRRKRERITDFCILFATVFVTPSRYCRVPTGISTSKVLWDPLNVGCLGCCSPLILAMSGYVLEIVRHADRWWLNTLSRIHSDNADLPNCWQQSSFCPLFTTPRWRDTLEIPTMQRLFEM